MALELPGGPPQQESFQVVEWGEGRGSKQQRVVRGHGLLSHQRCVRWRRRVAREEGGQKGGGGQRVAACQGSIFIGMLIKPAGEISL